VKYTIEPADTLPIELVRLEQLRNIPIESVADKTSMLNNGSDNGTVLNNLPQ
jgi:hypothetical protein